MTTVHPADNTAAMANVLADFFAAVSFPEGARPDYPAMRGLFCDGAQLIKNSGDLPEISSVDEFIVPRQQQVDSGELTSFEEAEVAHVTETFGNVGHRFSTYQKRGTSNNDAFEARGIICTQFIR